MYRATNSQYEDAIRILDMLELSDLFIDVLSGANKPSQTVSYFKKLIGNYDLSPEQCLSIGDNFINEIAPAIQLGMKTIFIDYYKQDYPEIRWNKSKKFSRNHRFNDTRISMLVWKVSKKQVV